LPAVKQCSWATVQDRMVAPVNKVVSFVLVTGLGYTKGNTGIAMFFYFQRCCHSSAENFVSVNQCHPLFK